MASINANVTVKILQKDEIKYRILDSARIEFQEKGFEKASIRNIARAANVSKSNIYNYFKSKELLFEAVIEDTIMEIEIGLKKLKENYNINGLIHIQFQSKIR